MSTHTANVDPNAVLAAIFDPANGPADLPAKTGLSLQELARWVKANAQMVAEVKEFITVRATFIASRLQLSSLNALERVTRESPDLERVRKAASAILRAVQATLTPPKPAKPPRTQPPASPLGRVLPVAKTTPSDAASIARPSLADRLAAMRLERLNAAGTAMAT